MEPIEHLVVFESHDWSDEFDTHGVFVTTRKEFEEQLAKIKKGWDAVKGKEFYFGTNEFHSWDIFEGWSGYRDGLNEKVCSKEFYDEFIRVNGGRSYGATFMTDLLEKIGSPDDEY
jgi:hypothetical protein